MRIDLKLTGELFSQMVRDLSRPHPFAAERIGFVMGRKSSITNDGILVLLTTYLPIPDEHYVRDLTVGARIGAAAMTAAMQAVYHGRKSSEGIFHVHLHPHVGETQMSKVDVRELPQLIPGFQSVGRLAAHGIIIFSRNHGSAWVWLPGSGAPRLIETISVIGAPVAVFERSIK